MNQFDNARFRKLLSCYPAKAIKFLQDEFRDRLINYSVTFTHDSDVSEDIVQETFNHVWEKNDVLSQEHQSPIEAYLFRVVKYKSITYYKSVTGDDTNIDSLTLSSLVPIAPSTEQLIIERDYFDSIRSAIATFPRREKQCLLLQVDAELTTAEIAQMLDVSVKAVQRSLTCAYKRLRARFR